MNLKDKHALVTGAGRGLGRSLARELARRGAVVTLVARDESALEGAAREIRASGGVAHVIAADVADKNAIYPLAARAAQAAGPIDILVNNASSLGPVPLRPLLDTDCEDLELALATNLVGPFRLTKALLGSMLVRRGGLVVNISSDAAKEAYPRWGAYSATKAALDHLTRIWAAELEGTGVSLLSVDPGEMDTRMHADAVPNADRASLARPEDVARAIASLIERHERFASGSRHEARNLA